MIDLKILDVRVLLADSAFLIDDGKTSILYDTGFGFTGDGIADNIEKALGERALDYILLTHSHYDHVLGSVNVTKRYPNVKVIAAEYAETIFKKPSARAAMRDLDTRFATTCKVPEYEDLTNLLRVDIPVRDGDVLKLGQMEFRVVALPGHTKCSIGFYLEENKMLLGCETLGIYLGEDNFFPSFLVSFEQTLKSFEKANSLDIESILVPHSGMLYKEMSKYYLKNSKLVALRSKERIKELLLKGLSHDEILLDFKDNFYNEKVVPYYPIDAFNTNTKIMIKLIENML